MSVSRWIEIHWDWLGGYWSIVIPVLMVLLAIIWLVVVYRKGKFQFLPALAIARVTVLDSIGRLEVIFLLIIGMLFIGVFAFMIFHEQSLNELTQFGAIHERIESYSNQELLGYELPENVEKSIFVTVMGVTAMFFGDVFVVIIGFVLSMFMIPNEINRGVILSILPKPLTRGEYIFGKFLGTWIMVTGCFLILAIEIYLMQFIWFSMHQEGMEQLVEWKNYYPINWPLLRVMFFFPFKYATLILIIMGFSLRMPEVAAGIVGLLLFIGGLFSAYILDMSGDFMEVGNHLFGYSLKSAYWVLPHVADASVSIMELYSTILESADEIWGWIWHVTVYNCLLMWLLSWLFRRRSL